MLTLRIRKISGVSLFLTAMVFVPGALAEQGERNPQINSNQNKAVQGVKSQGFELTLTSKKNSYEQNEDIKITATLRHLDSPAKRLTEITGLTYRIEITGPDGKEVPLTEQGRETEKLFRSPFLSVKGVQTEPGKVMTETWGINKWFDMSVPGEYSVYVKRAVPTYTDMTKRVSIYSNVVKITIEAPKKEEAAEQEEETQVAE